jgi:plastocyanin
MFKHYFILLLLAVLTAGCSKPATPPAAKRTASLQIDPATESGVVSGTVSFQGEPPKREKIDMSQDPGCVLGNPAPNLSESVLVTSGKLENVYVYIKEFPADLSDAGFPTPIEAAFVDQVGCRYTPHVLGIRTGQKLQVLNSDSTMHNVHPAPQSNAAWNESQMPKGKPLEKTFDRSELMVPMKCNQHPWMKMYLHISDHPYFAVTGKDGTFAIKGLPPGEYTVAALHEKFGEQTAKITVGPHPATANFAFVAASSR